MAVTFNEDFVTFPGDTVVPVFTVLDAAGNPVNISLVQEISWLVQADQATAPVATLTKTGGNISFVTTGVDGKFQVSIGPAVTSLLNGTYAHVATITDVAGGIATVTVGRLICNELSDWTYNAAMLETVPLFQVRRLVGDVIPDDRQVTDSEIRFAISARAGNIYGAAADVCRFLAAQYSRKVDTTTPGSIQTSYSAQAKAYLDMADTLENQAKMRGGMALPFAGGISKQQKLLTQQNLDRVQPSFNIGMMDNYLPVGQVGNETPTIPMAGSGP